MRGHPAALHVQLAPVVQAVNVAVRHAPSPTQSALVEHGFATHRQAASVMQPDPLLLTPLQYMVEHSTCALHMAFRALVPHVQVALVGHAMPVLPLQKLVAHSAFAAHEAPLDLHGTDCAFTRHCAPAPPAPPEPLAPPAPPAPLD
jgi:hypothetical protein